MRNQVLGAVALVVLMWVGTRALAVDNPPAPQPPGCHSTIVTSNGTVRDDELAKMISDAIKASGNTPSSVKVFFNSCYGGGMLDDIANVLATDFDPDIPFVGGSASSATEVAWGPSNKSVGTSNAGSYWTDSLAGAMAGASPGSNVSGTVGTANANDPAAPGGRVGGNLPAGGSPAHPQTATANHGDAVNWGPGIGVVFSGNNNRLRHDNNVDTMETSLTNMLGACTSTSDNTTQGLQNLLNYSATLIPPGGEFVLYVDDHGNTEFDWDEWWHWYTHSPIVGLPGTGWHRILPSGDISPLHEGWHAGLTLNAQQGDMPNPGINLLAAIDGPYWIDSFFDIYFNGRKIPDEDVPDVLLPGEEVFIPLDPVLWATIPEGGGPVLLEFVSTDPAADPLELINLELTSGPINDLDYDLGIIPGDANGDCWVNELDAERLAANWGRTVEPGDRFHGDFTGDGRVNAMDAALLTANWEGIPWEATAVPEPGTIVMLLAGAAGLAVCNRRRSTRR